MLNNKSLHIIILVIGIGFVIASIVAYVKRDAGDCKTSDLLVLFVGLFGVRWIAEGINELTN